MDGIVWWTARDQINTPSGPTLVQTLIPSGTLSGDGVIVAALSVGGEGLAVGKADARKVTTGMDVDVGCRAAVGGREVAAGAGMIRFSIVGVLVGVAIPVVVGVTILTVVAVGKKA